MQQPPGSNRPDPRVARPQRRIESLRAVASTGNLSDIERIARRLLMAVAVVIVAGLLVAAVARVLLVIFAGGLLALLFRAGAQGLSRLARVPVRWTLTFLILACAGLAVVAAVRAAPTLDDQFTRLRHELPAAIARLRKQIPPELAPAKEKGSIHGAAPQVRPDSSVVMSALGNSIEVLSALVVVLFIAIYGAAQPEQYVRACLALTPKRHRLSMRRILQQVRHDLLPLPLKSHSGTCSVRWGSRSRHHCWCC